jgi:hypothetical protein
MARVRKSRRGLVVLADGAQAAFAAGAVAELARAGRSWAVVRGAGLGAQVALLAALGEAAEAERRWLRQGTGGCPLLGSLVARGRQRLTGAEGLLVVPDALALSGWLDPVELEEHLAPDTGGIPERLHRAGASCAVAVEDLSAGRVDWVALGGLKAADAAAALRATVRFPAGWGPLAGGDDAVPALCWGGAGVADHVADDLAGAGEWDLVCGFPVPPVARPALGASLLELVQRREEVRAGTAIAASGRAALAPSAASWTAWAARDGADLGIEYPLPWERNGELVELLVAYGRFVARAVPVA